MSSWAEPHVLQLFPHGVQPGPRLRVAQPRLEPGQRLVHRDVGVALPQQAQDLPAQDPLVHGMPPSLVRPFPA